MSRLPNFATVDRRATEQGGAAPVPAGESWITPEGLAVKPLYTADDLDGLDHLGTWPGLPPSLRGPYPAMYVPQPRTLRPYAAFSTAQDSHDFSPRTLAARP